MAEKVKCPDPAAVADLIHSAAIRLLRWVRKEDTAAGVSAPQLSVLSVLVFQGPQTMTQLATAEQVRLPTMSKLISDLKARGLVDRDRDLFDRRVALVSATAKGRLLFDEGRKRRLDRLARALSDLSSAELADLASAAEVILRTTQAEQIDRAISHSPPAGD